MKIGIITTFRQPNWGSVLQAYALQTVLDSMGFEAWLIDYRYPNEFHYSRGITRNRSWLRNLPGDVVNRLKISLGMVPERKMVLLNRFINDNMRLTREYVSYDDLHTAPPVFDAYVAGSDQIWNPMTMMGDMSYFLDFAPDESLKFSYASSFSGVIIPKEYKTDYQKNLLRLTRVSVREDNGVVAVRELIGREAVVVADPTLLLDRNHWLSLANKARKVQLPEKFILCYMLGYTYRPDEAMCRVLNQLQAQYNLPVVALNALPATFKGDVFHLPKNYARGVEEFLFLINRATIIVSSSFHGTAFAVNHGKPFIAVTDENKDNDDRIRSLLNRLALEGKIFQNENCSNINPFYDFVKTNIKLDFFRTESIQFLYQSLAPLITA